MNKKCGKCSKTVYPTEELKCLDKVWHKACFKCQTCNMTLNMKNYKGYDKFPYCNAHYPTTKHTAVADTPESRRIAQNTKIQSNIKYHEQFEKEKGMKISVADDPETERLKKNMQVVSNVAYHNTLKQRHEQEQNRPMEMTDNLAEYNQPARRQIGSIADYDPMLGKGSPAPGYQPVSPPHHQQQQQPRSPALFAPTPYSPPGQFSSMQRQIGSVQAPDPRSNPNQAPGYQYNQSQSQSRPGAAPLYQPFRPQAPQPQKQSRGIVSQALYDYSAADTDEVSFMENDVIINCEPVDEGWMYGTVERSGQRGMLPSNYVQRMN